MGRKRRAFSTHLAVNASESQKRRSTQLARGAKLKPVVPRKLDAAKAESITVNMPKHHTTAPPPDEHSLDTVTLQGQPGTVPVHQDSNFGVFGMNGRQWNRHYRHAIDVSVDNNGAINWTNVRDVLFGETGVRFSISSLCEFWRRLTERRPQALQSDWGLTE